VEIVSAKRFMMEEGVQRSVTGIISWNEEAEGIKGLPTKIILDLDLDVNEDGTFTVYDIVDQDMV
jgi:hypothetical protein